MYTSSFSRLFALCSALATLSTTFASPVAHTRRSPVIPSGPKFVVYSDSFVGADVLPPLDQIQGFNVVNLAFLLSDGAHDQVQAWAALDPAHRADLKQQYNAAGVSIVASAFGETDLPTTAGLDPAVLANTMSDFVLSNDLDGIDVDWEETSLVVKKGQEGVGEAWLITFTQTLRQKLPQGQFILTHAPVAPWFIPSFCPGGCYLTVDKQVGALIDWYNIQYYNQSPDPGYHTCDILLNNAGGSSVFEAHNSGGVDLNKLVIGKPGALTDVNVKEGDTTNAGFMDPALLATCVQQATAQGWSAGVMAFQFPSANTKWISTVKGSSFQ